MEYRSAAPADYEKIRLFLSENGWEKRVADFARALCDEVSNGYIGTVAVAEDFRGRGIGRELVERLIGEDTNITWVLRAGRGSQNFWEKMGFTASDVAMEKTRRL